MRLPDWWTYPTRCHHGHEWGPGKVIVGWMTCSECAAGRANGNGHRYVKCRTKGCSSTWYDPPHGSR